DGEEVLDEQKLLDRLGQPTASRGSAGDEIGAPSNILKIAGCKLDLAGHTFVDGTVRSFGGYNRSTLAKPAASACVPSCRHSARTFFSTSKRGTPHPLAVVAADLKAVGAPTPITFHAAVMAPLVPAKVAIEQQAVNLHDPVDSLVIGRVKTCSQRACRLRTASTRR